MKYVWMPCIYVEDGEHRVREAADDGGRIDHYLTVAVRVATVLLEEQLLELHRPPRTLLSAPEVEAAGVRAPCSVRTARDAAVGAATAHGLTMLHHRRSILRVAAAQRDQSRVEDQPARRGRVRARMLSVEEGGRPTVAFVGMGCRARPVPVDGARGPRSLPVGHAVELADEHARRRLDRLDSLGCHDALDLLLLLATCLVNDAVVGPQVGRG